MRARRRFAALPALLVLVFALAFPAAAHRLAPSLLEVRELAPGRVEVLWKTPLQQPVGASLRPELPAGCETSGHPVAGSEATAATLRWTAVCDAAGLVGSVFAVRGLDETGTEALVRVILLDGRRVQTVLRAEAPEFAVPAAQRASEVAGDYVFFGLRHILEGLDHLLFVFALLLLVPGRRRLLGTITAFTLGHSVTLSLAVLGVIGFSPRIVEVAIAASILVVAVELAGGDEARPSRLRRAPWLMAGLFGLLHGLGFAGALAEVGLPPEEIPLALFSFNVGIEIGQLAFVCAVLAGRVLLRPLLLMLPARLERLPAYVIGTLAAYWCIERAALLF